MVSESCDYHTDRVLLTSSEVFFIEFYQVLGVAMEFFFERAECSSTFHFLPDICRIFLFPNRIESSRVKLRNS